MLRCPICAGPLFYVDKTTHHCINCNYGRGKVKNIGTIGNNETEVIRLECTAKYTGEPGYIFKIVGKTKIPPVAVSVEDINTGKHTVDEVKKILAKALLEESSQVV